MLFKNYRKINAELRAEEERLLRSVEKLKKADFQKRCYWTKETLAAGAEHEKAELQLNSIKTQITRLEKTKAESINDIERLTAIGRNLTREIIEMYGEAKTAPKSKKVLDTFGSKEFLKGQRSDQ